MAELRALSRSAKYCELQPKVFGKPIGIYFAELADRIEAAGKRAMKRAQLPYDEGTANRGDLCHED